MEITELQNQEPGHERQGPLCGAYVLRHLPTGRMYIGSTPDLCGRKTYHFRKLSEGSHPNRDLQEAYNVSPHVDFLWSVSDSRVAAFNVAQRLRASHQLDGALFNQCTPPEHSGPPGE